MDERPSSPALGPPPSGRRSRQLFRDRRSAERWKLRRAINCAIWQHALLELAACLSFCDDSDESLDVRSFEPLVHQSPNGSFDARPVDRYETVVEIRNSDPDHGLFIRSLQFHLLASHSVSVLPTGVSPATALRATPKAVFAQNSLVSLLAP